MIYTPTKPVESEPRGTNPARSTRTPRLLICKGLAGPDAEKTKKKKRIKKKLHKKTKKTSFFLEILVDYYLENQRVWQ